MFPDPHPGFLQLAVLSEAHFWRSWCDALALGHLTPSFFGKVRFGIVLTGVRSALIILHAFYISLRWISTFRSCAHRTSPTDRLVTARTTHIALPNNHPSLSTRSNSVHAYSTTFAAIQPR